MISITTLLAIVFLMVFYALEWYTHELSQEANVLNQQSEYVPEVNHQIKTNPDGSKDYSELFADAIEERKEARRVAVEMSSIEGTETESLLSSLQYELEDKDIPSEPQFEEEAIPFQEETIPHPAMEETESEVALDEEPAPPQPAFDVQERIYELRQRLKEFSKEEADMVDFESMIMDQYELFQLENREDQMRQLEKDFHMYFPKQTQSQSVSDTIPRIHEEDVLTLEDMEMARDQCVPASNDSASPTISDKVLGLQRWEGKVIGKSENYIHFTDNTRRIWIKAGEKIHKIKLGDELILEVLRSEEEVTIKKLFRVKYKTNQSHLQVVNK